MKYIIWFLPIFAFAMSVNTFIHKKNCSQIVNKQVYRICYSYEKKAATAVWYSLNAKQVLLPKIKTRPKFYAEKKLPPKYRAYSKDYIRSGYDRGHLANNSDFAYNKSIQKLTFSMANIVPQLPKVNRGWWKRTETKERKFAVKYKKVHIVNLVIFGSSKLKGISIPTKFYKIIYNNKSKFYKCYCVKNKDISQTIETDCSTVPRYIYNIKNSK